MSRPVFTPLARLRWLREADTRSTAERAVLAILVSHSDPFGHCFPSQLTIALATHLSDRGVRTALSALTDRGVIVRHRRSDKSGRQTDEIVLQLEANRHSLPEPNRKPDTVSATGTHFRGKEETLTGGAKMPVQTTRRRAAA